VSTRQTAHSRHVARGLVAALAILVGGSAHLQLYFRGGYRSFPNANLGRSFLLNGVASVFVAASRLRKPPWL